MIQKFQERDVDLPRFQVNWPLVWFTAFSWTMLFIIGLLIWKVVIGL